MAPFKASISVWRPAVLHGNYQTVRGQVGLNQSAGLFRIKRFDTKEYNVIDRPGRSFGRGDGPQVEFAPQAVNGQAVSLEVCKVLTSAHEGHGSARVREQSAEHRTQGAGAHD